MVEDAAAGVPAARSERLGARAFLAAHGLIVSAVAWLVLVLNFAGLQFGSTDELVQYDFVRSLFGDGGQRSAYLVGLSVLEVPFYAVGKVLGAMGLHHPGGHPITQLTIALAFGLGTLLIWPLMGSVMRGLELPGRGRALLAAGLGMPLFFYATFQPTKSHGVECILFALALYLTFRLLGESGHPRWLPFALGGVLALVTGTRYLDAGLGIALVLVLIALRRIRAALEVSVGGLVVGGLLLVVPLLTSSELGVVQRTNPGVAARPHVPVGFFPATSVNMLISNRRGLLLVSPIAVLGLVGLVVLWRRRPAHRPFLLAAYAMAAGVFALQATTPWHSGGYRWGFGQRYLTVLMPIVALGVAGAILAWPRAATAIATLCALWTVYLMLNLVTLGEPITTRGEATGLANAPRRLHISPGAYLWGVRYQSNFLHWTTR